MPRTAVIAFVLSLLACGVVALPAAAADHAPVLPDLVADPVTDVGISQDLDTQGRRRLLRFEGYVHNAGDGPLEILASDPSTTLLMGSVLQAVQGGGTRALPAGRVLFENDDRHDHWHLRSAARYSLWDEHGTAEVAPAAKVGFCLLDIERRGGSAQREFLDECRKHAPDAADVRMGISAGWRDVYSSATTFQWVDVSEVEPGRYLVRSEVDPDDVIAEEGIDGDANPPANVPVTVPGWVAEPVGASAPAGRPVDVPLRAARVGAPARQAEFRVDDLPQHGTLNVAPGAWFTGPVRYTPAPGRSGTDAFTVSAREQGVPFPRSPARATVTVAYGSAHVLGISGAPASVLTRSVTRLTATISRGTDPADPGPVSWSSDHGTVSGEGVFVAPEQVPEGGFATVRAATRSGLVAETRIGIRRRPAARPAPEPTIRRSGVLATAARRIGGRIVVAVEPRRSGRLRLRVLSRGRRGAGCVVQVTAGRRYVCRLRAPRGGRRVQVVTTLRTLRGRLLQRTLRVPARRARAAAHGGPGYDH